MDTAEKASVRQDFQKHETDTGSPEVQVAIMTARIKELTEHLKSNHKDHSTRRGLLALVSKRRRLLDYLKGKDDARYQELIQRLELRR